MAEDNPADVLLVQEALQEHQILCKLHIVQDGAKALEFVSNLGLRDDTPCPDLVLLDLNLPKADGVQILRELRKHPDCALIPVIVVSSSDAPKDRERVRELNIAHYFKKPLDFDAFLKLGAIVREVVETQAT